MQPLRHTVLMLLTLMVTVTVTGGCIASRKFVRNEVKDSSDELSSQIGETRGEIRETRDRVDLVDRKVAGVDQRVSDVDRKVSGVDGKLVDLDSRTTRGISSLESNLNSVNVRAEFATNQVVMLDRKFQNRNRFAVASQQAVLFAFDSSAVTPNNKVSMGEVARLLMENPNAILVLEGHTDSTGDGAYNIRLGERRIDAVRRYLAIEMNVPVHKIEHISLGAEQPVASNNLREERYKNRSVMMKVLVPSGEEEAAMKP